MTIPPESGAREAKGIASAGTGIGLSADEFLSAAGRLLDNGHHPIAIGKADTDRPDKLPGKAPWHTGVTGYRRRDPHLDRVKDWPADVERRIHEGACGILNIGIALSAGVIGIDVDQYDDKHGLDTIREHEARLGVLPPTYVVTARPLREGSGIRLFQVPESWRGKTVLKNAAGEDGHVELIQWFHRLVAVPPSWHHTGTRYRVYRQQTGQEVPDIPPRGELPKLPDAWLKDLETDPTKAGGRAATDEEVEQFAAEHTSSEQPWHLGKYIVPEVRNANGSTRNPTRNALCEAARDARVGWCSWAEAVAEIEKAARESYAERGLPFDEKDFARSKQYAVAEANAEDMAKLDARYAKRIAEEKAKKAAVDGWAPIAEPASGVSSRYRLVTAGELAQPIPPTRWLVRGIWPERSSGVLGGSKKTLKTWNLQAIAIAVAAGTALFDKYHVTSRGGVLYLCGEGGRDEFANRHQVIAERYGITDMLPELLFGVEFGVGTLTDREFTDAVKRHLDELQPKLVVLDPLYAYHPRDVEVHNVYERGPMLANLRELMCGEAALIVGDHFNKTASGHLDLDNIAQAGMAQWADSWILQKHRVPVDLENGRYLLEIETGTRRGAGKHIEVDWTLERDDSDPDIVSWKSVDWDTRPTTATGTAGQVNKTVERILRVVKDNEWELTESQVAKEVGGNRQKAFDTLNELKTNGFVVVQTRERLEAGKTRERELVGLGPRKLDGVSVPSAGTGQESGSE